MFAINTLHAFAMFADRVTDRVAQVLSSRLECSVLLCATAELFIAVITLGIAP
jgi:hypothetical protein